MMPEKFKKPGILLIFAAVGFFTILHHEIWLDEAHHWLLARDSKTLSELWFNARYEGHPLLWNYILFFVSRITSDVLGMQLAHLLIAVSAAAVVVYSSPFKTYENLLLLLGYFFIYEYTVISRNYALIVLLLFLGIVFLEKKNFLALALTLSLLANTHLFGLIISGCFVLMVGYQMVRNEYETRASIIAGAILLYLAGAIVSLIQIIPPADSTLYSLGKNAAAIDRLGRTGVVFLKAFVPIPAFTNPNFWNTNALIAISKPISASLSFALMLLPVVIFRKTSSVLFFFYGCALTILTFFFLSDINAARYYGIIYLVFVASFWLNLNHAGRANKKSTFHKQLWVMHFAKTFFVSVLVLQFIAAAGAIARDVHSPFSESKNTGDYIRSFLSTHQLVAGGCGAAPVVCYIDQNIFYLFDNKKGSFCHFNRSYTGNIVPAEKELIQIARDFKSTSGKPVCLITNSQIEPHNKQFRLLSKFDGSIIRNENYYLYELLEE